LAAGILFEGCTPDLPTQTRADEITAWLQKHPEAELEISHNLTIRAPLRRQICTLKIPYFNYFKYCRSVRLSPSF
jgi:hypothetical protein